MKQNNTNTEAPDEIVSMAIAYLDSPTDYREFIYRTEQPRVTRRRNRRRQLQEESPWLLWVPVVVIIVVIALMAR